MAGDVRGTFDLNDRPATEAMRRLQRQGEELDATLMQVGQTVDDVFNEKNVAEVKAYEDALSSLERQARTTFGSLSRNAKESQYAVVGSIREMDGTVALFRENLDDLSHTRATPKIDLGGVTEALAQVELLERRLSSLGSRTSNPRIGVPSSTVARDAVTAERVAAPNSGSQGSLFSRGFNVPMLGSIPYPLIAGALGAAPPLLGSATALGGSLAGAGLGAASVYGAAAGTGAAAVGLTAPVAIASIAGIKEAAKALESYRAEVIKSGVNSQAARQKYRLYNMELEKGPKGTARLLRAKEGLQEEFQERTKPAQGAFTGILTRGLNLGRQLMPLYSQQANQFLGAAQPQANQFANFLNSGSSRRFLTSMGDEATRSLRPGENIAENITSTLMSLSRAARPFFTEGLTFLSKWTGGWRKSSRDVKGVREDMRGWVGDLKSWGKLGGGAFDLLKDLGKASSSSGTSMIDDLTDQLATWDEWINKNPQKVRSFFSESVTQTEKIAGALGKITHLLWELGQMLAPLLTQLSQITSVASSTGLLTGPGLPLLLAGGAGIKNLVGGARGRILGSAGTTVAGAGVTAEETALGVGGAVAAPSLFARGRGALSGLRNFGSRTLAAGRVPVTESAVGGLTMAEEADAGAIGATRFSAATAARFGAGTFGTGVAGAGETFLRGAGARFLPIAALMGGLGLASSTQTPGSRAWFQDGISPLTAGIVSPSRSTPEKEDEATRHAQMVANYYAERYGGGIKGTREQILATRRKRNRLLTPQEQGDGLSGPLGGLINQGVSALRGGPKVDTEDRVEAEALGKQLDQLRASVHGFQEERVERHHAQAAHKRQMGGTRAAGLIRGTETNIAEGMDPSKALEFATPKVLSQIKDLGPSGGRVLAQSYVRWAQVAKRENPKLTRPFEELVEGIEGQFSGLGKHVEVVNGRIVAGTRTELGHWQEAIQQKFSEGVAAGTKLMQDLETEALRTLRLMGYSPGEAQMLKHEAITGTPGKSQTVHNTSAHQHGTAATTVNTGPQRNKAEGGRLPMPASGSLHDDVHLGNNEWAAGGELMVNRHSERRANEILTKAGTTLGSIVNGETRAHHQAEVQAAKGAHVRELTAEARRAIFGPVMPGFATGGRTGMSGGLGAMVARASRLNSMHLPYLWGGGHGGFENVPSGGLDCSGSVSDVLHAGGLLSTPETSGTLMGWGEAGAGTDLTVYANPEHTFMKLAGHFFGTSTSNPGGGPGWISNSNFSAGYLAGFSKRHMRVGGSAAGGSFGGEGVGGAEPVPPVHLHSRKSGLGGAPGAAADRGNELVAGALSKHLTELTQKHPPPGGGVGVASSGGSVIAQIGRGLMSHGLNKIGAAGIIGNAKQESGWKPDSIGSGGGGLWGFTSSPYSLSDLQTYAQSQNRSWKDASLQTQFLLKFLSGGLKAKLNAAKSPGEAAAVFMNEWERPAVATENQANRESGARTAFAQGYSTGGRKRGFAGWFADGGRGRVSGPTLIGLGESGPEDFTVTPSPKRGRAGRRSVGDIKVEVNMHGATITNGADAQKHGDAIGRAAAKKLREALEESDDVNDGELIGA